MFDLVDSGSFKVHNGVLHVTPARYNNWVELREKATGLTFTRINTHVCDRIETAGLPRVTGALVGQNARAKQHFAALRALIVGLSKRGRVIVGGDFNVDYLAEKRLPPSKRCPWFPYSLLSPVATVAMADHGTHGGRAIDWTLLVGVHEISQTILPHGSSDHNPVLTVVEL